MGGILKYVSATALSFLPFRGNQIQINGVIYNIPTSGVAGLANTNVYLNGVAGQNLAASTLYRVYCFNNAGVLTADFSTTAHATSLTAGNVGTEIKSNDNTRTFIGLIYANVNSQFADIPGTRYVRSWVNRRSAKFFVNASSTQALVASTWTQVAGSICYVVCFADEEISLAATGCINHPTAYATSQLNIGIDGTAGVTAGFTYTVSAGVWVPSSASWVSNPLTEGLHNFNGFAFTYNAASVQINLAISGTVG
jgi:hypothetical protein